MRWRPDSTMRIRRLASRVPIPEPFDIPTLCRALATERNRPIELLPIPGMTEPCGVWIATDAADYIAYDSATSPLHRDHIVLHELGHLLNDHLSADSSLVEIVGDDVVGVDPALIRRVAGRTSYGTVQEREAELLAGLIRRRADRALRRRRVEALASDCTVGLQIGPALGRSERDRSAGSGGGLWWT